MKNLPAFKKLINRYETITLEEIKSKSMDRFVITGFGSLATCSLCKSADKYEFKDDCRDCVYYTKQRHQCLKGKNKKTYDAINLAETPKQLLKAYRNRAKHMRGILKTLNIEL